LHIIYLQIMKLFALEAWYMGKVQGVGFRYTVMHLAKGFEVVGEVKNLSDGRVYVQAQGSENEVNAFHKAIAIEMHDYIKEAEFNVIPIHTKRYSGFSITYESPV
jgi:acylphosphatase